jgi:hypothetical protein
MRGSLHCGGATAITTATPPPVTRPFTARAARGRAIITTPRGYPQPASDPLTPILVMFVVKKVVNVGAILTVLTTPENE